MHAPINKSIEPVASAGDIGSFPRPHSCGGRLLVSLIRNANERHGIFASAASEARGSHYSRSRLISK